MNKHKNTIIACLLLSIFMPVYSEARESEAAILQKLNNIAQNIVQTAARTIMPSKAKKAMREEGNYFVASYVEVDTNSLQTELRKGENQGHYVGLIKYVEYFYECQGASQQQALKSSCLVVKSRRLTEIISYDGKWHH